MINGNTVVSDRRSTKKGHVLSRSKKSQWGSAVDCIFQELCLLCCLDASSGKVLWFLLLSCTRCLFLTLQLRFVTLLVLFLKSVWPQRPGSAQLSCLGGLFLATAVLIIITVAWGALHKHQSVQALVAAARGHALKLPRLERSSKNPPHRSDFRESLDQIFNPYFLAFLGISWGPQKISPLGHHSPYEIYHHPFWENPCSISHCIPITFPLHCHYISTVEPLYPSMMVGPKAKNHRSNNNRDIVDR